MIEALTIAAAATTKLLESIGVLYPMRVLITPNKCYATCGQFADAALDFLRGKVPKRWKRFRDSVSDNFRVISPKDFWVVT
jgi:hypothetical protein